MTISIGGSNRDTRPIGVTTQQTEIITGFNGDVDTASAPEDIWPVGGLLIRPSAPSVAAIVSDDAADTSAGTGLRSVFVEGLDSSFDKITEIVTMNGTTPVNTVATFAFVNALRSFTVGSTGANEGLVTASVDGNPINAIAIGKNLSSTCISMMPTAETPGTVPHIQSFAMFVGKQQNALVSFGLTINSNILGIQFEAFNIPFSSNGAPIQVDFSIPAPILVGDIMGVRVLESSANDVLVAAIVQLTYLPGP